ncbi:Transposase, MuDR, plant [Sesbania bispinosa]|nr:Transposase, MuDR, plant [Sesbania bispinosa]
MANTRGGPSVSRFDRGSNEHAPPIDQEVLSSQVDDPSPKDVPNAICMKADGVNLIEVPVEVQTIGGEELDDPNYLEDDENETEESEGFIDTSEDEGDDIYDTLKDPIIEKFSDYEDNDELVNLNGSENSDDDTALKWPEFNKKTDLHENVELVKGMKFDSNVSFRKALMEWTIKRGYDNKYIHNDKSRVTATCKDSCGWRIHASPTQDNSCFQIKSFNPIHQCGRHYDNKRVTAKWVAGKYAHNPELKCNMLLNNIAETFNAYIKEARDKPIITMLEMIRRQLMKRFHVKRDGMLTRRHSICPRILEKLEVSKKDAMNCLVHVGGHRTYEITPGRPKKKRIREEGEPSNAHKINKKGTKIKCGNCNMEGHNAKTCKMPLNPNRKVYRKKKF